MLENGAEGGCSMAFLNGNERALLQAVSKLGYCNPEALLFKALYLGASKPGRCLAAYSGAEQRLRAGQKFSTNLSR